MEILSKIPRARKNCDRTNLRSAKTRTRTPGTPTPGIRGEAPYQIRFTRQNSNEKPRGPQDSRSSSSSKHTHTHNRGGEEEEKEQQKKKNLNNG